MPQKPKIYRPTPQARRVAPAEPRRGSRHERGYTARWSRFAKLFLREHPTCALCADRGRTEPATCVDHVDGKGPSGERGYDPTNLRSLCHSCHSRKTVKEDGGFGRKPKVSF